MTVLKSTLVIMGEEKNLTLFVDGEMYVASQDHGNWDAILAGVLAGDASVVELFDIAATVAKRFERLTTRASVSNGVLYFDGDEMHTALAGEVVRFLNEGVDDWKPLVAFLEKVQTNPQEHSREQLFTWLERHEFTLTDDGDIVGYKGVHKVVVDGEVTGYRSGNSGHAIVNGVSINGVIPQKVGDIVEMPRSEVTFDPKQGCSAGLHVANYNYAKGYGSAMITVAVNPRDVVSVPTDSNFDKVRVCRYVVTGVTGAELTTAVQSSVYFDLDDDETVYCDECDEPVEGDGWCDDCEVYSYA